MNTNHYPSLELCKKLTEIGFPETDYAWRNYNIGYAYPREHRIETPYLEKSEWNIGTNNPIEEYQCGTHYDEMKEEECELFLCPSVMEMLDVMPYKIDNGEISYYLTIFGKNGVQYQPDNFHAFSQPLLDIRKEPPNALAEMILWLHENKYITFPANE